MWITTRKRLAAAPRTVVAALLVVAGLAGCADSSTDPEGAAAGTQLLSVSPAGGATGVPTTAAVRIEFDGPMAVGSEDGCRLHAGDLEGPAVNGDWTWSEDHRVLTFAPHEPMAATTEHVLHLGGGLLDAAGHHVGFTRHGAAMGGMHVDGGMMGGTMGGGMMGGSHEGAWWEDSDGGLGWMFSFRTDG